MSTLFTRLATPRDIDAVAALFDDYRQFYEYPPDLQLATAFILERMQRNESVVIVAEMQNRIVGFCQLYPAFCSLLAAPIFLLYDLYVSPEFRKLGAARALLQAAELHAAQNGFARLDLTTAKTNTPAQSLYESLGWVRDDIFLAYSKTIQPD